MLRSYFAAFAPSMMSCKSPGFTQVLEREFEAIDHP